MFAEESAAVVRLIELLLDRGIGTTPADGVGEDSVHEGVGVVRPEALKVASEGWSVDEVEKRLDPAPVHVEEVLEWLGDVGVILKNALLPGIGDEALTALDILLG